MATSTTSIQDVFSRIRELEGAIAGGSTRQRHQDELAKLKAQTEGTGGVPYGDVAASINRFQTEQAQAPFVANLPGYTSMLGQRSGILQSQLAGEVPQDVVSMLAQQAAERGIATGMPGSANQNASYLRALGLTSIGQQQLGQQGFSQAIADTPVPELFNVGGLFGAMELGRQELGAFEKQRQLELDEQKRQFDKLNAPKEYSKSRQSTDSWGRPVGSRQYYYRYFR